MAGKHAVPDTIPSLGGVARAELQRPRRFLIGAR